MELSTQTFLIEKKVNLKTPRVRVRITDKVVCRVMYGEIHVTITPCWSPEARQSHAQLQTIRADSILVLNLNHSAAYGHIYTEVLSELLAVDETYSDYECIVTAVSPLMLSVIESFNLKLSDKIKFVIRDSDEQPPFILEFNRLKIVTHCPKSYPNKVKNIMKLKNAMHSAVPIVNKSKNLLLYCSRRNKRTAKNGRKIDIETEDQVIEVLKQHALETGLEFYFWSGTEPDGSVTPILKQYDLYSNSKLVVGVHGGSFSNIIFLDPAKKPTVIELCPSNGKSFYNLSDAAFGEYATYHLIMFKIPVEVSELELRPAEVTTKLKYIDSSIDIDELKQTLLKTL